MWRIIRVCGLLLLILPGLPTFVYSPADNKDQLARRVVDTAATLQRVKTNDDFPVRVPSAVRPQLRKLKHQLRELIQEVLNLDGSGMMATDNIRRQVISQLQEAGANVGQECGGSGFEGYGCIYDISFQKPDAHPNLRVVTTSLGIPCGVDNSLYIFQNEEQGWRLRLALEANDYAEISSAQAGLTFSISPPDLQKDWFLVTAHFSPWCASTWSSLHYRVHRLGSVPDRPRILLEESAIVHFDMQSGLTLTADTGGFSLSYEGEPKQEANPGTREIVAYCVSGNQVMRAGRASDCK